jgi:hypothetical protein
MVPSINQRDIAVAKMKTISAAVSKAADGPKKNAAQVHMKAAEVAKAANRNDDCLRALNAAAKSIS